MAVEAWAAPQKTSTLQLYLQKCAIRKVHLTAYPDILVAALQPPTGSHRLCSRACFFLTNVAYSLVRLISTWCYS
jgi:hypothetical protein